MGEQPSPPATRWPRAYRRTPVRRACAGRSNVGSRAVSTNATNAAGTGPAGAAGVVAGERATGGRGGGAASAGSRRTAAAVPAASASAPRTASGRGSRPGSLWCRGMGHPECSVGYVRLWRSNVSKPVRRGAGLFRFASVVCG
ncbi:hypothetical protein ACFQQB_06005 [Nonomuraea rubra]|uniref:hypothetical protein n=1 Tax=Nonomuraea rubra TaxID=46180 RepID=UPI00361C7D18